VYDEADIDAAEQRLGARFPWRGARHVSCSAGGGTWTATRMTRSAWASFTCDPQPRRTAGGTVRGSVWPVRPDPDPRWTEYRATPGWPELCDAGSRGEPGACRWSRPWRRQASPARAV